VPKGRIPVGIGLNRASPVYETIKIAWQDAMSPL